MKIHSLRFRMAAWYAGVLALCLMAFGASVYLGLSRYLTNSLKTSLHDQTDTIGDKLLVDANRKGVPYVVREINEMAPETSGTFIRITREDGTQKGNIVYQSPAPFDKRFTPSRVPALAQIPARETWREERQAGAHSIIIDALPYVTPEGSRFVIEVGSSSQEISEVLHGLLFILALGMPLVIAAAIAGGYLVMKRALQPLDEITRHAETISSRNFGERLPSVRTGDEIERLTTSLNRMISRLEEAFQLISRFSADVSHELRTPLTILRVELESVAHQEKLSTPMLETIGSALEEIERLSKIVNQLLEISRLEAGEAARERKLVNLGELATTTAEQMRLMADEKSIHLNYRVSPDVVTEANPALLKQVVVNLLDNAIKYTPAEGTVEITVEYQGKENHAKKAVLEVRDHGIGIPAESLPHICERFYRADKARSRHSGGAGLGLSIVKSICDAQGAELKISSSEGVGTRVRIEMPRAAGKKLEPVDSALLASSNL